MGRTSPQTLHLPTCERLWGTSVSFVECMQRRLRAQEVQEQGKSESQSCPADSCSPAGQRGAGLRALPTVALTAAAAAAAAVAGPTAPAPQWPRSEARPQTGPKCPAWLAKRLSCPDSAMPIPRPVWTHSACCGVALTGRKRCSGSFTSPQW